MKKINEPLPFEVVDDEEKEEVKEENKQPKKGFIKRYNEAAEKVEAEEKSEFKNNPFLKNLLKALGFYLLFTYGIVIIFGGGLGLVPEASNAENLGRALGPFFMAIILALVTVSYKTVKNKIANRFKR